MEKLAYLGGKPLITKCLPSRRQFDSDSENAVKEVFDHYNSIGRDFGTDGPFYRNYADYFSRYLDSKKRGFTEVVCSGTVALYVAIQALALLPESHVLVSPITDPGMVNPVIISGHRLRLIDYDSEKPEVTLKAILAKANKNTKLVILNHLAGKPIDEIQIISDWARENGIFLIEDASQCHGGTISDKLVGTFGDIACFSTMYSKNHSSGGAGGLIYTHSKEIHQKILLEIDKGKPTFSEDYVEKDPGTFTKPALNFRLNEISCAIGLVTLKKLDEVNQKRRFFLNTLSNKMHQAGVQTELINFGAGSAPFFAIFKFQERKFKCSKIHFSESLRAEGVTLNSDYKYAIYDWPWIKKYLIPDDKAANAQRFIASTFNLLFNENYSEIEADLIVNCFLKVEKYYGV